MRLSGVPNAPSNEKSFVVGGRIHEKELERILNPGKKEYRKPEAFDVPKEVQAMAEFFGEMFPGSKIEIQRVDLKRNPRNKRRNRNKRNNGKGGKQ